MKHAFLIMAHGNLEILNILLSMLEDPSNDIYLHLDSKMGEVKLERHYQNLYILEERMDLRWGDISLVKCELNLFQEAFSHGPYLYYHLLSGADLPLKSNEFIHDFFNINKGKEFVGYSFYKVPIIKNRVLYYYFFSRHQKNIIYKFLIQILLIFQKLFHFQRSFPYVFAYGSQWVSISNDCVNYIISKRKEILDLYKNSTCCDEVFMQTLLRNSPFYSKIFNANGENCNLRLIGWKRGRPYVWTSADFNELMASDAVFARKFDKTDIQIVYKIMKAVMRH